MRYETLNFFHEACVQKDTRVLMRLDLNIDSEDHNSLRIMRALPDIEMILQKGGRLIIAGHRGRPKGKEATLSTKHLVNRLEQMCDRPIVYVHDIEKSACERIWKKQSDAIILLENLRFFEGEEKDTRSFAKTLSTLADVYVNNAFGVCHRKHASVHRITSYLPSFAGCVLKMEIDALNQSTQEHFVLILGGAKLETKIPLLKKLAPRASTILLGSAYAPAMITKKDFSVLQKFKKYGLQFPTDIRVMQSDGTVCIASSHEQVSKENRIIDIGPDTEMIYAHTILSAKYIVWNGPVGIVEEEEGEQGTLSIMDALMYAQQAHIVIGGGDTISRIDTEMMGDHIFLSTGGGAMLAFLSGSAMPGLHVLQ